MTLLDISILLMVVGIIMGPLMHAYKVDQEDRMYNNTEAAVGDAQTAINEFYFLNGRYPCPANITLGPDDPNYGVESCPAGAPDPDGVIEGGVPFATLKVPVEYALDGFKHKLTYAVTQAQADNNPPGAFIFNKTGGRIVVSGYLEDGEDACTTTITNSAVIFANTVLPNGDANPAGGGHFTLISHGETSVGAYTAEGDLIEACPNPANTTEAENCDGDAQFFSNQNDCAASMGNNAQFYDDYVAYIKTVPEKIWTQSPVVNRSDDTVSKAGKYVGIGTDTPQVDLDVIGSVKAVRDAGVADKNGNAQAMSLCTSNLNAANREGVTCFRPTLITGADPNMRCDTSNGMVGIARNRANCNVTYVQGRNITCGADELMTGLAANGSPICAAR